MLGSAFLEICSSLSPGDLSGGGDPPWYSAFYNIILLLVNLLCCGPLRNTRNSLGIRLRKAAEGDAVPQSSLYFTVMLLTQKSDVKNSLVIQLRKESGCTRGGAGTPQKREEATRQRTPKVSRLPS